MSYLQRPSETVEEQPESERQARPRLADFGERVARALGSFERGRFGPPSLIEGEEEPGGPNTEAFDALAPHPPAPDPEEGEGRFPVAPLGYSRAAVDGYLAEMEREIAELRAHRPPPPPSINEELARLGEQTASILVTAHDQASETTRRAQEQAERCVAEAAARARQMTADAQRRLRELDAETDAVWQERRRLIEDVRLTAQSLLTLAGEALERFPAEERQEEEEQEMRPAGFAPPGAGWPPPGGWSPPAA